MTDQEFESLKDKLVALSDRWLGVLGLKYWRVTMLYSREQLPVNSEPVELGGVCLANTSARWRYRDATITFNMPALMDKDDEDLETVFVHECMHIVLNETRQTCEDWLEHEVRVATDLTYAFLCTREEGVPPKAEQSQ